MQYSPLIQQLIDALKGLPGIGPKSAQRMAFQLLQKDQKKGLSLSNALEEAIKSVKRCKSCQMLCEENLCPLCQPQTKRQKHIICMVENPGDIVTIEKTCHYQGLYFVLFGRLSPLDGVGPAQLGLDLFFQRIHQEPIQEVIIATSSTVEGDATAHYVANKIAKEKPSITCSQIAYGIPANGELEHLDSTTIAYALNARTTINSKGNVLEKEGT
jgi:recombination protein RecR